MRRITAVLALLLLAGCGSRDSTTEPISTPSLHPSVPPHRGPFPIVVRAPVGMVAADGLVWVASSSTGTLVAVDPATRKVVHRVAVGDTPLRAAYDGALIWVSVFGAGRVVAVDPRTSTVVRRVTLDGQPEGVASGFGSIWVVRQQARELTRLSRTGKVMGSVPLGSEPRLVTAGAHDLWVSDYRDGTVTRVTPAGRTAGVVDACQGAQAMVEIGTTLWVACTSSDQVVGIDEASMGVTRTMDVPGEPDGLRAIDGQLWVVATDGPTLVGIDPVSGAVVSSRSLGFASALHDRANDDLESVAGRVVVSSFASDLVLLP